MIGPHYGYELNPHKTIIILGKCDTVASAVTNFDTYTNNGVPEDQQNTQDININNVILQFQTTTTHIHPDNIAQAIMDGLPLPQKYQVTRTNNIIEESKENYGLKVLGSHIGSDEYINKSINQILDKWKHVKDKIIQFPKSQLRMLLFRYCFCPKPIYLLRTIPAKHTATLSNQFVQYQLEIINSMFQQNISESLLELLCLPIENGGIGILNYKDIHSIAHIASMIGSPVFTEFFSKTFNNDIADIRNMQQPFLDGLIDSVTNLSAYLNLPPNTNFNTILHTLNTINNQAINDKITFQSALYIKKNGSKQNTLEPMLKNLDPSLKKLFSYRNTLNDSAGMWLKTFGRDERFRLSNTEFTVGLCLRYCLEIPMIQHSDHCTICKGTNKGIDKFGHHFLSGCLSDVKYNNNCAQGAQPHAIHDQIRRVLYHITRHASVNKSIQEPRYLLHDSKKNKKEHQLIPDLHVNFPIDTHNKTFAVDLSITCPFDGSASGKISVPKPKKSSNNNNQNDVVPTDLPDKNALLKRKAKNDKYQKACTNRGIIFVPFIIFSTGKIHMDGMRFLNQLAKHGQEARDIDQQVLVKYYVKLINFALIKEATHTIYVKAIESKTAGRYANKRTRIATRLGNLHADEIANPPLIVDPVFRQF